MFDFFKQAFQSQKKVKEGDFIKHGFLTPEQFEKAGDQLTMLGWKWEKASSPSKKHELLPNPEKQYLSIEGRSEYRIKDIMKQQLNIKESEGGFIEPEFQEKQNEVVQCRQYIISISYDGYYHCPRLWLKGHDEDGSPLDAKQIFEDITAEHINETVTYNDHPHLNEKQVTIHPCKHSDRLKQFVLEAKEKGVTITPEQALIVFMQFMPSVMPTIELDGVIDVSLGI